MKDTKSDNNTLSNEELEKLMMELPTIIHELEKINVSEKEE